MGTEVLIDAIIRNSGLLVPSGNSVGKATDRAYNHGVAMKDEPTFFFIAVSPRGVERSCCGDERVMYRERYRVCPSSVAHLSVKCRTTLLTPHNVRRRFRLLTCCVEEQVLQRLPCLCIKTNALLCDRVICPCAPALFAYVQVLSLLDLGLVDRDNAVAYYDALTALDRTAQDAKEAALAASLQPLPTRATPLASSPTLPPEGLLSLVPFPAVCIALGVAGSHALHLTGTLDAAAFAFGAIAGASIGGLIVAGDDSMGRAARAFGGVVTRSLGAACESAGKGLGESAVGAAGAVAAAAQEAIVKTPSKAASSVSRSWSDAVSATVGSMWGLPGVFAKRVAEGVKRAIVDTSNTVVNMPGDIARQATLAAGNAFQSSSEAAISAVKEAPQEAKRLVDNTIATRAKAWSAFISRAAPGARVEGSKGEDKVRLAFGHFSSTLDVRPSVFRSCVSAIRPFVRGNC